MHTPEMAAAAAAVVVVPAAAAGSLHVAPLLSLQFLLPVPVRVIRGAYGTEAETMRITFESVTAAAVAAPAPLYDVEGAKPLARKPRSL